MDIIFLNSKTGEQLTMPVTPPDFHVETGRNITQLDMAQTGQVNLPGLEALFNEQQTFLLPSSARNYTSPGYSGDPYVIVDTLTRWSLSGDVLRLVVTETPVNLPILLAPVRYGEEDGTGDIYVTLTMRQYRELAAETTEQADTGNAGRAQPQEAKAAAYTVVRGDTMWGIHNTTKRIRRAAKSPEGLREGTRGGVRLTGSAGLAAPADEGARRMKREILVLQQQMAFLKKVMKLRDGPEK